jgi:uncharacterized membrane protein (UPF0127 family)
MRTVVLRTAADQERGLQWARAEPGTLYAFPDVPCGAVFHSRNVQAPFDLAFLSRDWAVLWSGTLVPPWATARAPPGSWLAIESEAGLMGREGIRRGARVPRAGRAS